MIPLPVFDHEAALVSRARARRSRQLSAARHVQNARLRSPHGRRLLAKTPEGRALLRSAGFEATASGRATWHCESCSGRRKRESPPKLDIKHHRPRPAHESPRPNALKRGFAAIKRGLGRVFGGDR